MSEALVNAGAAYSAHELVGRTYSFYYRCGLSNEAKAVSIGKITAVEFEEKVGIVLYVSHARLIGNAEVRRITYKDEKWCLVTLRGNDTDYYPGILEIH